MSGRFRQSLFVLVISFLFILSPSFPTADAARGVTVEALKSSGDTVELTLSNQTSQKRTGYVVVRVIVDDGSSRVVRLAYSLNSSSTGTFSTSLQEDVFSVRTVKVVDDASPM